MKKICVFFLALAVFLLPEMVYAANATPQAVNMPHVYIVFGVLFVAAVLFFTEWIPLAVTSILVKKSTAKRHGSASATPAS